MALIKINIEQAVASESAAKKPMYKLAKVAGAQTLVINATQKSGVSQIVDSVKQARSRAIEAINARIKAATAFTKANQTPKGPKRTALKEKYKTEKAMAATKARQAKINIRVANSIAKKVGLGGLVLPIAASDIVLTGPGATKALKSIRAVKANEFGVTGKRGTFKPKFVKEAAFEALGEKKTAAKKTGMTAGGVGGAHTAKKAATLRKKRAEQLGPVSKKSGRSLESIEDELTARDKAKAKAKKKVTSKK